MSSLYERLYQAHQKRYGLQLSKQIVQQKCNTLWAQLKEEHKANPLDLRNATEAKIRELNEAATRQSASFFNYFAQVKQQLLRSAC